MFFVLVVVATRSPSFFAIWIARLPTPPAPAWISTRWPGCELRDLAQRLQRGQPGERDRRRLLERRARGLVRDDALVGRDALGEAAHAVLLEPREHLVADVEAA